MLDEFLAPVADALGRDLNDVAAAALNGPHAQMTFAFTLEDSAATAEEIVRNHLDAHYRRTLDEPLPMLGHRTPRECAADPAGRRDALVWLKTLEHSSALMPSGPAGRYDFAWLWAELDLEHER